MRSGRGSLLWVNHFAIGPGDGGGTRHFEMSRALTELGWRVTIAASDFNLQSRSYTRRTSATDTRAVTEMVEGVEFMWLHTAPYRGNNWRRGWNWLSFGRSLRRATMNRTWDVIIGSSPHLFAATAAAGVARRSGVPFVFEVRDLWPESILAAGGRKGPFYMVLDRLASRLYRMSDRIVVLAGGSVGHIRDRGVDSNRIAFIPNGVETRSFDVGRHEAPAGELTLIYAGAHGAANGLDVVLEAAALLGSRPAIRFRLLGDGPAKPDLMRRARELALTNVTFDDPVPKSSMPGALAEAGAGLMVLRDAPLFAYGVSPNKLFDYFAAGLPVVCNVPGEVAEMVREAGAGEVCAPGDAGALAQAVRRLADREPEERTAMGRGGREWVTRERNRTVLAGRLDDLLREVVRL